MADSGFEVFNRFPDLLYSDLPEWPEWRVWEVSEPSEGSELTFWGARVDERICLLRVIKNSGKTALCHFFVLEQLHEKRLLFYSRWRVLSEETLFSTDPEVLAQHWRERAPDLLMEEAL